MNDDSPHRVREVYRFPGPTFIENVAIRPNGHLLITTFHNASLYDIDPTASHAEPKLVAQPSSVDRLAGVVQVEPDVFVVTGGLWDGVAFGRKRGSMKAFKVDLRLGIDGAVVEKLADVPDAQLLNGMAALTHDPYILLSMDGIAGRVFRINAATGKVDLVFQHELLRPSEEPGKVPIGANGAKIWKDYLYFTNTSRELLARVKLSSTGERAGEFEILFSNPDHTHHMPFDDFDVDRDGNAYVALHEHALCKISSGGSFSRLVDGDSGGLLDPTSVALSPNGKRVFVVTAGKVSSDFTDSQVVEVEM